MNNDRARRLIAGISVLAVLVGCTQAVEPPSNTDPTTTTVVVTTTTTSETTSTGQASTTTRADPSGELSTTSLATTTTMEAGTPTSNPTTSSSTTTTLHPDGILGILTTTGVPVRLKATQGERWLVASPCGWDTWIGGGTPIYQTEVILDPGHGGDIDTGAVGPNGLEEKVVNLRIAQRAQQLLERLGVKAVLTRTADYASTLPARSALADGLQATVMVSIHHNAPTPPPSDRPGNEVYVQFNRPESRRLGELLFKYSMEALSQFDIQWSSTANRGVMVVRHPNGRDLYGILRNPKTPTALLEFGRLSHAPEAELFATPLYVETAAKAIASAVDAYLHSDEKGEGSIAGLVRRANPGLNQNVCVDPDLEWQLATRRHRHRQSIPNSNSAHPA